MRNFRIFPRILATHLAIAVGASALLGLGVDRILEHRAVEALETRLVSEARTIGALIGGGGDLQALARKLGTASGTRITLVRTDGVVVADSEHDPATMDNHASRPEIAAALRGRRGASERVSGTLGRAFLYVATPPEGGVVVRTALAETEVDAQREAVRRAVALAFLVALALALSAAALVARSLSRPLAETADAVSELRNHRGARVEEKGPQEVRNVVRAINALSSELDDRLDDLRRETSLRERVLQSMEEGVLLAESNGAVAYANPRAKDLLGDFNVIPPHIAGVGEHEIEIRHPNRRSVRVVSSRLDDGRILVVLQDVTEVKKLESIRRDFVADASHELKTPVAAVLVTAETLEHAIEEDPDKAPGFVRALAAEARRLSEIVKDLLDLSRIERQAPAAERFSLSDVLAEEVGRVRASVGSRLTVAVDIADGVDIVGRSEDIALAIRNLLENAVRYTDLGSVTASLSVDSARARVVVDDTGPGIPKKDLPRIFERFYRVDKARSRETGGTGLGLSIVRNVVEAHGGEVSAESELGRGSRFVVSLPLVAD